MISGLNHVQITIPNGEEAAARAFYSELMGLPEIDKPASLAGRGGFWVALGSQQLHIGTEDGIDRARTKAHVAYQIRGLDAWRKRLEEAGVAVLESVPISGYARFECRDPFGNRLEFIEPLREVTTFFSDRAEVYARYRPGYPEAIMDVLRRDAGFMQGATVADVGAGTGILTELFLRYGHRVLAVEPSGPMRQEAERRLGRFPGFVSVDGRAEATTLPDTGVDLIAAGQAFHWFEPEKTRVEFGRILRPGGLVVLIWNQRATEEFPIMAEYEAILGESGRAYPTGRHAGHGKDPEGFFRGRQRYVRLNHSHELDFETLWGRFLSASYAPRPEDSDYETLHAQLRAFFDKHESGGIMPFHYDTHLYWGPIHP